MSKKIFFVVISVTVIALAGCFGEDKETTRPAADEKPAVEEPATTPSFSDGDLYIKALSEKKPELCKQIKDEKLRTQCEVDTKK